MRNISRKQTVLVLFLTALLVFLMSGCTNETPESEGVRIVATNFPAYDFARAVAGECGTVTMLIKPGAESHTYDPTPKDIQKIETADLFIYGGGASDRWIADMLSDLDTKGHAVLAMTEQVPLLLEEGDGHDHEAAYDEHVWTSPDNAITIVNAISKSLSGIDPENSDIYQKNAESYITEIEALKEDFAEVIREGHRDILVFADRYPFLYFSEAFDLRHFSAFAGCAHETEPGAQTIAEMIDLVKTERIPAVFYIEFSNCRLANAVAEATGCNTLLFHSCHNVTKAEWESGVTYVSLMRGNLENLRKALS